MQVRKRTCTNPPPSGDGKKCEGPSTKTESCNTQECKENTAIIFLSHLILCFAVQIYKIYHLSKMTFVTPEFKRLCGCSKDFFNFH